LVAVITNGAEFERLKSADPEKVRLHPASCIVHVNAHFEGSVLPKMVSASKDISSTAPEEKLNWRLVWEAPCESDVGSHWL
jgi:hypothetical protein